MESGGWMIHGIIDDPTQFSWLSMNLSYAVIWEIARQGVTPQGYDHPGLNYVHLAIKPLTTALYLGWQWLAVLGRAALDYIRNIDFFPP